MALEESAAAAARIEQEVESAQQQYAREKGLEDDAARQNDVFSSLERENVEMDKHMRILSDKAAILAEQLALAMKEIHIVTQARDNAQDTLDETQIHLQAIQAQMVEEAELRAQEQVQQHLSRQVWLETALRSAFVQERAMRASHSLRYAR